MKVVIPDLVSNSYFPAIAAVEMGFFKEEGLDAELELIYPVGKCYEALRDGKADFVGGSSHSAPTAFPEWQGVKFLGALAQHTYWFLIMRVGPQGEARRCRSRERQADRRGAADRHRPDRVAEGIRHRSEARQRADRAAADAGQSGRRIVRRQCREGDGGGQDRRLLGQRHGRRSGGEARPRHHGAGRAARRRACELCAATPSACWRPAPTLSRRRRTRPPPRCARWSRRRRR